MKSFFKLKNMVIDGDYLPISVADKLREFHIGPMESVRHQLGSAVWASEKSGYRNLVWEKQHGRSGNSEHCFEGKGAVDWCTEPSKLDELYRLILEHTNYTRICRYPTFIHVDYKAEERQLFTCDGGDWVYVNP